MSEAGLSPATVRQAHRVLSLLIALAVRDGRLPRNVTADVRLPRARRAEKVFLTHAQVAELARAAGPHGLIVVGRSILKWPHRAPLIWPHLGLVAVWV